MLVAAQFRLCRFGFWGEETDLTQSTQRKSTLRERRSGQAVGQGRTPLWRTGPAVAMEIRGGEEISTGRWGICNFGLRIADMKRRVGLCLVALLPA